MSESGVNNDAVSTFVVSPVDNTEGNLIQIPEQFHIIKNVIIKSLSDGSLYIMEANDFHINQEPPAAPPEIETAPAILDPPATSPKPSEKPTYNCSTCEQVFDKKTLFRKHMMWHRNVKKFKCDKCSAGYNVESNLKVHMAVHAEGKPTCPNCSISFQRLASLKSHLLLHQVEEFYTCEECKAEFDREEELNRHLRSHLNIKENKEMICSYCKVKFEDSVNFKQHVAHHRKVKKLVLSGKKTRKTCGSRKYPHVCGVCLKSFRKLSLLDRHSRVHSGERPFVCQYCKRGFNQKGTLKIHLNRHSGFKPFHCTLCTAKFYQKGNLRVHVAKTHMAPTGVKTVKCPYCTCIFTKIGPLNVHITRVHDPDQNLEDVVNKLKELEQQTAAITPEMKPAAKEIVEQNKKILEELKSDGLEESTDVGHIRFAGSVLDGSMTSYLVKQRKVNDCRTYICNDCNKEFKKASDLIRHTRVHTRGERPFACRQCSASFSSKATLFNHLTTHCNGKNYVCNICWKILSTHEAWEAHLKNHASRESKVHKVYKCNVCNDSFHSTYKLRIHKEVHKASNGGSTIEMREPLMQTPTGLLPVSKPENSAASLRQFSCQTCNAKFGKASNLKRHMLLHGAERKYKCEHCPKSYLSAHALREHCLYHSGTRNYSCKTCGKKYVTLALLKRHLVSHNSSRPYVCPYCSKAFKSLMLCKKHINIHKKEISSEIRNAKANEELDRAKLIEESNAVAGAGSDPLVGQKVEVKQGKFAQEKSDDFILQQAQHLDQSGIMQQVGDAIDHPIDQQLFQMPSGSVQILPNKPELQDTSQVQTIFINYDELQLTDGADLCNTLSSNSKIEASDSLFFNTLSDLPDPNVFNIDQLTGEFDTQAETYNNTDQTTITINDLAKILKIHKDKPDQLITDDNFLSNTSFYSNPELNLSLNIAPSDNFPSVNAIPSPTILPNLTPDSAPLAVFNLEQDLLNLTNEPLTEIAPNSNTETVTKSRMKFTCAQCRRVFTNKSTYARHVERHANKGEQILRQCDFCAKAFKKQSDLVRHIRTHTGEKPFPCNKCDKKFSLKSTLLSHQRTHNPVGQKRHNCVVCNSFFTFKSSLNVHMKLHTGVRPHECSFCPMKFRTASHKKSHESSHHLNARKGPSKSSKVTSMLASVAMETLQPPPPSTEDLNNVVIVQEQLQLPSDDLNILNEPHNSLSDTIQLDPMILQQLQSSHFLLQDQLIPSSLIQLDDGTLLNIKTVNNDLNLVVDNGVDNLPSNVDVQSIKPKPRNHECDICHKKYASKDVLRKHKKRHGVNRKFPCSKCDKGFDTEEALDKHEKVHEGYRPFSCLYCNNSFAKEQSLAAHVKRIHQTAIKEDFLLFDLK